LSGKFHRLYDDRADFRYTSSPINDSIWLAGGSLAIGAGNQIYLFSRFLDRDTPLPSPTASGKSMVLDPGGPEDLFQLIAWHNGPLLDYHPTVLAQCLIWGRSSFLCLRIVLMMKDKVDLVKRILLELHRSLKECEDEGKKHLVMKRFDPFDFVKTITNVANSPKSVSRG
jgi:hypothetical protein